MQTEIKVDYRKLHYKMLKAKQTSELDQVKLVLYHSPHIIEVMGYTHPLASLFQKIPSFSKSNAAYQKLVTIFKRYNVHYAEVTDILKRDKKKLTELAKQSTCYIGTDELIKEKHTAISDDYKNKVLDKLDVESLLSAVYSRAKVHLKKDSNSTGVTIDHIEIEPLSNLVFIRDQQIVTAKGLVIGNTQTFVRKFQKVVLRKCFEILKIKPIGEATEEQYIQGGDFMSVSKQLALIQIGIRSNIAGANYLMDNDLLGTRYFGVVKDEHDRDQQRMHLDTIFNLIDETHVVLLDFDDPQLPKNARRDVDIYERQESGRYTLKQTLDFQKFLVREGYNIIKVSHKQQQEFIINFVNIGRFDGKYVLVTSNRQFQDIVAKHGIDVTVEYIEEFQEVNKMHGSFHCVTQVFR